jgi:hypothetical protein
LRTNAVMHSIVIVAALVAPAQKGYCSCNGSCACGCQQGKPCECLHDGKKLPAKAPAAKPAEKEREQAKEKVEPVEKAEVRPTGTAYPVDQDGTWNFGLDKSRISGSPSYTYGDTPISYGQMMNLIEQGVPDDRNKLRLTVIGPESDRKRVLSDLESPELAQLKDLYTLQAFEPNNPIIQNLGFVTTGRPTIYIQKPTGEVLHRQDEYRGPASLAMAIRAADPNHDPNRDPDLTKPKPKPDPNNPVPDPRNIPTWVWVLAAVGVVLILMREGKGEQK